MFDRNNRPAVGNLLTIQKGFVKSVSEAWAKLPRVQRNIDERNGIHFLHDGDKFVVTPANPQHYDDNFVCKLVCVSSEFKECIGFELNLFEYQEMPGGTNNNLNYIHLAKYLKLERERI